VGLGSAASDTAHRGAHRCTRRCRLDVGATYWFRRWPSDDRPGDHTV